MALVFLGLSPAAAVASTNPSQTIAGAQQLTVGAGGGVETGGGHNIDYWTVQLNGGDQLVVSINASAAGGFNGAYDAYRFELYAPGTTDKTFSSRPPLVTVAVNTLPPGLTLQAPYTGKFVLAICEDLVQSGPTDCRSAIPNGVGTLPSNIVSPMNPYTFATSLGTGSPTAVQASSESQAGSTIETASSTSTGDFDSGGGDNIDFWTLQLTGGDQVGFSINASTADGFIGAYDSYLFELYAPGTTDATFSSRPPLVTVSADALPTEITLQAPYTGNFVLAVCEDATQGPVPDCRSAIPNGVGALPSNVIYPMHPYTFATSLASSPPPTSPPPTSPPPTSPPATSPPATSPPATSSPTVPHQTPAVTTRGLLSLKLTCRGSLCSGTMKLRATSKRTTGRGKRKKTRITIVTIGGVSFSKLADGAHHISLRLDKTGLRLLIQDGYRLTVTVVVTYKFGSTKKTISATITLKGERPKKTKRR
jgi:hypothetical protein